MFAKSKSSFQQIGKKCNFKLKHLRDDNSGNTADCFCPPSAVEGRCRCARMGETWFRNASQAVSPHKLNLVAYIRHSGCRPTEEAQREQIDSFCKRHGYNIRQIFVDEGHPSHGLSEALEAVRDNDGLIAADLTRFVEHDQDPLRDLRPFVHHFFCNDHKHLIAICEEIDTGEPGGQKKVLDIMNNMKEF